MGETSKTATNALRILASFDAARPVRTASELARELNVSRTSVLRLLTALEGFGFVARNEPGGGYRIGVRAFEIGALYFTAHPMRAAWTEALGELVARTQCTAYLATLDGDDTVMLGCKEGTLPIRFVWKVGDRLPCATTSLGKAMFMHMTREQIDGHLGRGKALRGLTPQSLRRRAELDRDIEEARKRGWAMAREESHAGLTAIGSAILDEAGRPVAAISVSLLDHPPDPARIERLAGIVTLLAARLSEQSSCYSAYASRAIREMV